MYHNTFSQDVVLVTGAGGGVGQVLCEQFHAQGATVIALDHQTAGLEQLVCRLKERCHPVLASVTELPALTTALAAVTALTGPVTILINNAGAAAASTLASMTPEAWRQDIDLNLNGAYYAVEAVKAPMLARQAGIIINIGTVNALQSLGHPAYSAAKAGLMSYTRSLAVEYGPKGIRANMISPASLKTAAWDSRIEAKPDIFDSLTKWYPLRFLAEPEDIAALALFLASPAARAISGVDIPVDGGLSAGNPVLASELTLQQF